jgi:colanic acid/amylovoran biosynthesis protein
VNGTATSGPRVALINVYSRQNTGDALLAENAVAALHRIAAPCDVAVVAVDPHSFGSNIHGSRVLEGPVTPPARPRQALNLIVGVITRGRRGPESVRALRGRRYAFSCPGGFLHLRSRREFATITAVHLTQIALCKWFGATLIMLPQSVGPFRGFLPRMVARRVLSAFHVILVRDAESLAYLRTFVPHLRSRIRLAPDLAIASASHDVVPPTRQSTHPARVGVVVRQWWFPGNPQAEAAYDRYLTAVGMTIRALVDRGSRVDLLIQSTGPTSRGDDRHAARAVRRIAERPVSLVEFPHSIDANTLLPRYGEFDVLIATRLHAALMGILAGIPTVAIGYEPKSREILGSLGASDWVVEIEDVTAERLLRMIHAIDRFPGTDVAIRLREQSGELSLVLNEAVAGLGG